MLIMKNLKKLYVLGLFVAIAVLPFNAYAVESGRYFVKSNSQFWKNAFNVRSEFEDGFTADLNDWQFKFGRILGLSIESVPVFQILPDGVAESSQKLKTNAKPGSVVRLIPSDQTPWGIEYVYKDFSIAKTSGGAGAEVTKVAVLDTGITQSHPDLKARIAKCEDFTDMRFPVVEGKCVDKNGHGTHVSGIIAADGGSDGLGIYGVAPQASLYAFKVCSQNGSCYADDISVAVKKAADEGANIINLSLGSDKPSSLISSAIDYAVSKGVLVVAAGGNDGPYPASIDYPAAQADVIAVGAFGLNFVIPDWSSRGINSQTIPFAVEEQDMELAAPGVNIESAWKDGGYAILSGTSMAAPFVSGLAAKYWQLFALETNPMESVRNFLHTNALDIDGVGDDNATGFGFARVQ